MIYRTMDADNRICHRSDLGRLPEGAMVIKTYSRHTYDQRIFVTEHEYETVVYRDKDTIDNSLAERCIRPLANERKNSLFFGSDRMARVSAGYHSVVSTCRLQGHSILEYLKRFFTEITVGNRDYEKLMPSTIGISANEI